MIEENYEENHTQVGRHRDLKPGSPECESHALPRSHLARCVFSGHCSDIKLLFIFSVIALCIVLVHNTKFKIVGGQRNLQNVLLLFYLQLADLARCLRDSIPLIHVHYPVHRIFHCFTNWLCVYYDTLKKISFPSAYFTKKVFNINSIIWCPHRRHTCRNYF